MMKALTKNTNLLVLGILLIAAFFRLYKIADYMTFLGDEGRDVLVVYNILHGKLTLLGPTSSVGGFFTGPIYYYFMAPFLWLFNYDPVGPAVMVALFGVFTVWFVYKIGAEFFNKPTGLIAASLYTISPLVVIYSRSSWNPNLMPISTLLTLYLLYKAVTNNSKKFFLLSGISFGIAMQLHYVMVFVGIIIALYTFLAFKEEIKKVLVSYIFIFTGFLIGFSPFLAFETRHGFQNIKNIINFIFNPQGKDAISTHAGFIPTISDVYFRLFGRLLTNYPQPEQVSIQAHFNIFILFWATLFLALGSSFLFISYFKKAAERAKKLQLGLLLVWFVVGILSFGFYRKNIYDYYFEFMFPLPFLLVGNFIFFLLSKKGYLRIISVFIFLVLIVINFQAVPFNRSANKQLEQTEKISQFVLDKTNGKPYNFGLISGGNSDHAYRYFFKILGRDPVEIIHGDENKTTVTDQLLVVCEDQVCQPLGDPSWQIAGFGRSEIAGYWEVSVVRVYKLVHYKGK